MVICRNDILSGSLYRNRIYKQSARFAIQDSCLTKIMLKIMYKNFKNKFYGKVKKQCVNLRVKW
jgi:hypothetical protein